MKTKGDMNGDPVALAKAKLGEHDQRKDALDQEAERLASDLDQATLRGDAEASDHAARELAKVREQLHAVIRVRRHLVEAVGQAEARLRAAQGAEAEAEYQAIAARLLTYDERIAEVLRDTVAPAVHMKLTDLDRMRALVAEFQLPHVVPQGKVLLPKGLIRSKAGEILFDALSPERAFGVGPTPAS